MTSHNLSDTVLESVIRSTTKEYGHMWNSLRIRLATIIIGLALGPLLVVGVILIGRGFAFERTQALDFQGQIARRAAAEVDAFLRNVENDLNLLNSEIRSLEQPDNAQQLSLLLDKFNVGPYRDVYEEFILLDGQGQEQLRLSRLKIFASEKLVNRSGLAEFEQPKASRATYFGPVQFDAATGEALMTVAIPLFKLRSVQLQNVLIATIRFKQVGDLIAGLQVGEGQTIYVVDQEKRIAALPNSEGGALALAFDLPKQAAFQTGLDGTEVVLAVENIRLGEQLLRLVVERSASEALASAVSTRNTIIAVIGLTLLIAAGGAFLIVRQTVRPIEDLATTARAISAGDLSGQVVVRSRDELGTLATAFNAMATQLRDFIGTLEERVQERTRALEATAEISHQLTEILDVDEMLAYVVDRVQGEFDFYHTHIYLIEAETGDLVMARGFGEVGRQLKEVGHRLDEGQGIVGTVASTNEPFVSNDVDRVLNFVRNPLLPHTKSELAVPLRKGRQVLGVLDIQSELVDRFSDEDVTLLQSIANQTATVLDNARLLADTQANLQEIERLNRRITRQGWSEVNEEAATVGYRFVGGTSQALPSNSDMWLPPMKQAAAKKQLVKQSQPGNGVPPQTELAVPLILRGEVIGVLGVKREEAEDWAEEEVSAVEAVANQVALALESARLSEEQEKTIVKLQDVDRIKSEFLTSMSHELRTPLNSIIGFADVIIQGIDGDIPELAMNDVKLIYNSGQHLLALINDILDISKIEAGMMELIREPLDLKESVDEVLAATSSLLKNKPVEVVVDVPETLPPVNADKLRLNQILLNLVSNAIKFTEEGQVSIKAEVKEEAPTHMSIAIIDEGIGIPEDKFGSIFDRFSQADSSTTRQYGGTGLGLPICKQLAEMHGGIIGVTSEVEVGSTFYFTIPLADENY